MRSSAIVSSSSSLAPRAFGKSRLARDPRDHDALLGMTLASGLRADYAALIEKRSLSSLHYTKESSAWADQLLAAHPSLLRRLSGGRNQPLHRWVDVGAGALAVAHGRSIRATRLGGISELQTTAAKGRLLAPFARILLAIAYVRDKDTPRAREILLTLQKDFPNNHLFPLELARLRKLRISPK